MPLHPPSIATRLPLSPIRKEFAKRVSIPHRPVRLVRGAAPRTPSLATFPVAQSRSSYIKVAALMRCPHNTQGEHHAFHDDPVSENLRNRETRLGTRPQSHGENGQVQRGTRESRRAACAGRSDPARDDERARPLQRRKVA